jgi:hypothetical protein
MHAGTLETCILRVELVTSPRSLGFGAYRVIFYTRRARSCRDRTSPPGSFPMCPSLKSKRRRPPRTVAGSHGHSGAVTLIQRFGSASTSTPTCTAWARPTWPSRMPPGTRCAHCGHCRRRPSRTASLLARGGHKVLTTTGASPPRTASSRCRRRTAPSAPSNSRRRAGCGVNSAGCAAGAHPAASSSISRRCFSASSDDS